MSWPVNGPAHFFCRGKSILDQIADRPVSDRERRRSRYGAHLDCRAPVLVKPRNGANAEDPRITCPATSGEGCGVGRASYPLISGVRQSSGWMPAMPWWTLPALSGWIEPPCIGCAQR